MGSLARHTKANREFFEPGHAPTVHEWVDWIRRGVVPGKLIDGKPWVELNRFAVSEVLEEQRQQAQPLTGMDLLNS
jgi:hypothetical protein